VLVNGYKLYGTMNNLGSAALPCECATVLYAKHFLLLHDLQLFKFSRAFIYAQ